MGMSATGCAYDAGMPLDPAVVDPSHTAIVMNEIQRGTVGDRSALPMLVEAAAPMVTEVARLVRAGRGLPEWRSCTAWSSPGWT